MSDEDEILEKILELIQESSPETIESFIEQAQGQLQVPKEVLIKKIIYLHNQGKLVFSSPSKPISIETRVYLFSTDAIWFWILIFLTTVTTISIFTIQEKMYPYIYFRYLLGSIFVLFLPGYSLVKTLFPTKEIDNIERTAYSIGMSLALVSLAGLLLNYTSWGISLTPITISLLILTIIFSVLGLIREHKRKSMQKI